MFGMLFKYGAMNMNFTKNKYYGDLHSANYLQTRKIIKVVQQQLFNKFSIAGLNWLSFYEKCCSRKSGGINT